jgi:hypothetical protein
MAYHSKKRLFLLTKPENLTALHDFLALLTLFGCQKRMLLQGEGRRQLFA